MEESYLELDGPDIEIDIIEYNNEFTILNDRSDKSSSSVWKHFGTIKYRDGIDKKHVYCVHCFYMKKIKKYQRSTSTGNLSKHLQIHHNISLCEMFRVKKEQDNSIHLIRRETEESETAKEGGSAADADEFIVHDINEILISEVSKRPLLYRSQAQLEGNGVKTTVRRQLWAEVHQSLNHFVPLARLPTIWKNIRDRYHKVRRVAMVDGLKPKYRYYEQLRFLDQEIDERKEKASNVSTNSASTEGDECTGTQYMVSGDHHYTSTKPIAAPMRNESYETVSYEPKLKKRKVTANKTSNTHLQPESDESQQPQQVIFSTTDLMEETYVHATTSDIYTTFGEELQTQETEVNANNHTLLNQGNIEVIATTNPKISMVEKKADEFEIFGNFIAEIMRNKSKPQARLLQMNIMRLIADSEDN